MTMVVEMWSPQSSYMHLSLPFGWSWMRLHPPFRHDVLPLAVCPGPSAEVFAIEISSLNFLWRLLEFDCAYKIYMLCIFVSDEHTKIATTT